MKNLDYVRRAAVAGHLSVSYSYNVLWLGRLSKRTPLIAAGRRPHCHAAARRIALRTGD